MEDPLERESIRSKTKQQLFRDNQSNAEESVINQSQAAHGKEFESKILDDDIENMNDNELKMEDMN